jgi:hypothetical protein
MPEMLDLKVFVMKPNVSSSKLPRVALPRMGVPVRTLATMSSTMPEAKNMKMALYFFRINFATMMAASTVNAIKNQSNMLFSLLLSYSYSAVPGAASGVASGLDSRSPALASSAARCCTRASTSSVVGSDVWAPGRVTAMAAAADA